jgi:hypothetical protein
MKVSPAGKVLGPQSDQWETATLEGEQVIVTPGGRILRLQQLQFGKWDTGAFGPADSKFFVEAANLLREKNVVEKAAEIASELEAAERGG